MRSTTKSAIALFALLTLACGSSIGWAAEDGAAEDSSPQVRIERRVHCEGDGCSQESTGHKAVFIDQDGNRQEIEGDHHWVGADGPKHIKMMLGSAKGGYLGVGLTDLTPELRGHFGVPETAGVMVSKVVADSPAERAGIQVGDIVTLVDADEVASAGALAHAIGSHEGGTDVTLEIWRDGKAQKLTATLDEHEGRRMAVMPRIHAMHGAAGGHGMQHLIEIECDDDSEDCSAGLDDFDCGGAGECEVRVQCSEGSCTCTVNGDDVDCATIPGVPAQ